jgi:hypothetical protein
VTPDVTRSLTEVGVASAVGVMIAHAPRTERLHARGICRAPLYGRSDWCGRGGRVGGIVRLGSSWTRLGRPIRRLLGDIGRRRAGDHATAHRNRNHPVGPSPPAAARQHRGLPRPTQRWPGGLRCQSRCGSPPSANQTTHASAQNDWMRPSKSSLRCCLMRVSPAFPFGRAWTTIGPF